MWDLTVPGNNDHDFYVVAHPADTSRTHSYDEGGTPVLVHNTNDCENVQNLVNGVQGRARLAAATQSNVERGPVLSGALDTQTGAITYAQNASSIPDPLHPDLQAALNAFEGPGVPFKGIPGAHSEIYAVNEGLYARPGATIGDFLIYSVRLQRSRLGEQILMCPNCAQILSGASDLP
jgi:hypothetical protein